MTEPHVGNSGSEALAQGNSMSAIEHALYYANGPWTVRNAVDFTEDAAGWR